MKYAMNKGVTTVLLVGLFTLLALQVLGDPSGATISNNTTENGPTFSPDGNASPRSTITTMVLTSIQQDQYWKGYVGNVTGTLTLDDAASNTLYDWSLAGTAITGEVYSSRSNGLDFSTVVCADTATVTSENTFFNMSSTQVDNINGTFNETTHDTFVVAGNSITNSTCSSQVLFVSDTRQTVEENASFQEILVEDNTNSLVFVSLINDDTAGFDTNVYDFQMILPESSTAITTYYFYVELG